MSTLSPFPPGGSLVAYLRDSGGDNQDLSVPQQNAEITAWCQANNLNLTRLFKDEARPGSSTVSRVGFLEMIQYFEKKPQPPELGVIVWKFSRFSRNIDDSQYFKGLLRRLGLVIHSLNENIPQGLDGRLFEAAVEWMNARFLEDLSEDVKRGLRNNVIQHHALGGTPPRGFRPGPPINLGTRRNGTPHIVHTWQPDPDLIPIVRQAFNLRSQGASYQQITRATSLYKHKTSWNHFFANPIYMGKLIYGTHTIDNYCDPIIDLQTWENVQMVNTKSLSAGTLENEHHPRRKTSDYILSGLVVCAICGAPLVGETVHSKAKNHTNRYYGCSTKRRTLGAACAALLIPQAELENAVINDCCDYILAIPNLAELSQQFQSTAADQAKEIQANLKEVQKQQTSLTAKSAKLVDRILSAKVSTSYEKALENTDLEIAQLDFKIKQLTLELARVTSAPDQIQIQINAEHLRQALQSSDRAETREALRTFIFQIHAQRLESKIVGQIDYYIPADDFIMYMGQSHQRGSNP